MTEVGSVGDFQTVSDPPSPAKDALELESSQPPQGSAANECVTPDLTDTDKSVAANQPTFGDEVSVGAAADQSRSEHPTSTTAKENIANHHLNSSPDQDISVTAMASHSQEATLDQESPVVDSAVSLNEKHLDHIPSAHAESHSVTEAAASAVDPCLKSEQPSTLSMTADPSPEGQGASLVVASQSSEVLQTPTESSSAVAQESSTEGHSPDALSSTMSNVVADVVPSVEADAPPSSGTEVPHAAEVDVVPTVTAQTLLACKADVSSTGDIDTLPTAQMDVPVPSSVEPIVPPTVETDVLPTAEADIPPTAETEAPPTAEADIAESEPPPVVEADAPPIVGSEGQPSVSVPAAEPFSPPEAANEAANDDSGCEVEPEPVAPMSERHGPDMADVEQLARSVVTDTLERAKQDASLHRQLEHSNRDPDTDDDGWLDIVGNGQLKKKVVTRGTGGRDDRPRRSMLVTVRLSARLADTGADVVCDPDRLTFGLGDGEVVTGLDMAVALMQPGETAELMVDPRFAYGDKGLEECGIPPGAGLLYTVALESVQPEPKCEDMSTQQRLQTGSDKRDRGNWWFKREEYNHALQCYRRALDFFDNEGEDFTGLPDDVHVLFEERLKVHNNMAAAQMKLEAHDAALRSLQLVLNCQPTNIKALYRKGKVLALRGQLAEAAEALRLALQHSPDNRTVQSELNKVTERQRKAAQDQKSLYRKMLGLPPAEDASAAAPAVDDKKFRMPIKLLVCGVVCGLAAVVVSRLRLF